MERTEPKGETEMTETSIRGTDSGGATVVVLAAGLCAFALLGAAALGVSALARGASLREKALEDAIATANRQVLAADESH